MTHPKGLRLANETYARPVKPRLPWDDAPTDKTPNPWPIGGYAPGGYTCKCHDCQRNFIGDKRASQCLECAVHALKGGAA